MPVTFTTYLVAIISVAGIPPMAGFISKWLIYQELISRGDVILGFAAFFGSIGSFMYVFRPLSTIFLGQLPVKYNNAKEVPILMQLPMIIITGLTIFLGVFPHYILQVIAKIQQYVGIKPVETSIKGIMTSLTKLDPVLIFSVFAGGFIVAFILYFLFAKTTKVEQWEQYTAGEIVPELQTSPEIYHYAKNYYMSFERMFKKFVSLEKLFFSIVNNFKRLFEYIKEIVFESNTVSLIWISILSIFVVVIIYFIKLF
jgi:NADH-quinone oxidoreductase subunit M